MKNMKDILVPTSSLIMVAFVMTSLMFIVNHFTEERIQNIMYADLIAAKQQIFPQAEFIREAVVINGAEITYYIVGGNEGYIFTPAVIGYGGNMIVVVGINPDGAVIGVEVAEHDETPGLGTRVFDYEFISQFKISYTARGFIVGYNIDTISGSTITVDALILAVNDALDIYREVR